MAYLPDSCTVLNTIPFVSVLDMNTDLLILDPSPGTPSKPLLRQAQTRNCRDIVALRSCLNEQYQARVLDMQRGLSWMFPVIATKFDLSVGLLDWAHSSSSIGDNLSIDSRLQSIIRADEKIYTSRCFIGLDLLKLFDSPKKGKKFFRRHEGLELFRITAPGVDRTKSAFKRRFSCCVKLNRSPNYITPHRTLVFITDYPAHDQFPLITYNIWDPEGTPMSLLEDVFAVFIADLEKILDSAQWHLDCVERQIILDPTHPLLASQLLYDKNSWNLLLSQTKSMLNAIERLNHTARRFGQPDWLPIAKSELTTIKERIQVGFIEKNGDLTSLMRDVVALEEARAAMDQGESIRRISWLVFIFLPLSLMAAIFGMNVDVFKKEPRLKWFLIAAAVLLVVVITALIGFRTLKRSKRKQPAGIYSALRGSVL